MTLKNRCNSIDIRSANVISEYFLSFCQLSQLSKQQRIICHKHRTNICWRDVKVSLQHKCETDNALKLLQQQKITAMNKHGRHKCQRKDSHSHRHSDRIRFCKENREFTRQLSTVLIIGYSKENLKIYTGVPSLRSLP